jgi:hypothetical protein
MKTLVQHRINGAYAGLLGRWVPTAGEAMWFPTTADALFYCVNRQLRDVQLLVETSGVPGSKSGGLAVVELPLLDSDPDFSRVPFEAMEQAHGAGQLGYHRER